MKIFDHHVQDFITIECICWRYKDVISNKYDGIQEIKGTGFHCSEWNWALERWMDNEEYHEYDILVVELRCGKRETNVFGVVEWRSNIGSFVFYRLDIGKTVMLNGLYNVKNIGSSLKIFEKDIDKTWKNIQDIEHGNQQKQNR